MRISPLVTDPPIRRLGVLILASALAASLAGCGSSSTTQPPSMVPAPASAAAGGGGDAGGGASPVAGGGGTADCPAVTAAATDLSLQTQTLYQVDSADRWKALADPSAPLHLDALSFAAAVKTIAALPGGEAVAAKYRPIADLETQAFAASDPWGGGSGPAAQAHEKVAAGFIEMGVALTQLLEAVGCAP